MTNINKFREKPVIDLKRVFATAGVVVAMLVSGCSSKPPACGDEALAKTLQQQITDAIDARYEKFYLADDPDGLVAAFKNGLKVRFKNVVTDSYREDAKKFSCSGELSLEFLNGKVLGRPATFTSQKTEGSKDAGFLVTVVDFDQFKGAAFGELERHYESQRWSGNWGGTFSCGPLLTAEAQEPETEAFSVPVTLKMAGRKAGMEVHVKDGLDMQLYGNLTTITNVIYTGPNIALYQQDENKGVTVPTWGMTASKITGEVAKIEGDIFFSRVKQRQCTISVERGKEQPKLEASGRQYKIVRNLELEGE